MLEQAPVDIVDRGRAKVTVIEVEADWCDTCSGDGSQVAAFVYAKMPSGLPVSYCAHHGTKYWDRLNAQASLVIDMRDTVLAVTT